MTSLSPLTPDDIPEVMRLERLPGYDAFVGRFEAEEHAWRMAAAATRYFGLRDGRGLAGFVILTELDRPRPVVRRIAVAEPGGGRGTALLRAAAAWVFQATPARGIILDVVRGNARARHVYAREGFVEYAADATHHFLQLERARWAELSGNG